MPEFIIPNLVLTNGLQARLARVGMEGDPPRMLHVRQLGTRVLVTDPSGNEPSEHERIEVESIVAAHRAQPF